jgi:2',5'-phosphodiesterase
MLRSTLPLSLRRLSSSPNMVVALCNTSGSANDTMSIDLDIRVQGPNNQLVTLVKNMGRKRSEPAQACLERIRILLSQQATETAGGNAAKQKRNAGRNTSRDSLMEGCPPIGFTPRSRRSECEDTDEVVTSSMSNEVFWSRISSLVIGETKIGVLYNCPTVTHLAPPHYLAVGMPAMCSDIRVLFSPSPAADGLIHEWRCSETTGGSEDEALVLSRHRVFIPTADMEGASLVYRCKPVCGARGENEYENALWTEIQLPPVKPSLERQPRWQRWLDNEQNRQSSSSTAFKVMSYNILHDDFCTSKFAKTKLYPFATDEVLNLHFRKSVVVSEIADVRPDIFCFQECGQTVTDTFFRSAFEYLGYQVVYGNKNGLVREGCLTGFSSARYDLVGQFREPLVMSTLKSRHPELAETIIKDHPHLEEALHRVTSIGLVTVLRDKHAKGRVVVVGNTHLFYHPNGCHIRAIQALLFLHLVNDARHSKTLGLSQEEMDNAAVVVAGDFNFTRITGGYKLMTTGAVDEENSCWQKGHSFWWGCDKATPSPGADETEELAPTNNTDNIVTPPPGPPTTALAAHLVSPLSPLIDTHLGDGTLQWTNYSLGFKAIIDHIFVDSKALRVIGTIPQPSEAEFSKDVAIPSAVFPSDHVPIIAELDFQPA